ncbi:signal peptidase I [Rummeliibacillus sp. JY-2-4R]
MGKQKKDKNELWEWTKALIIAFALAAGIRYLLFTPIVVDGESMMPTLVNGDRMIVNKLGYRIGDIHRFDIVVFHAPEQKDYIKRIIGLPGDKVAYKNDQLYINGKAISEPYLQKYKNEITDGGTLTEDFTLKDIPGVQGDTIPPNYVFVMGDNRRYSKDSRHIGLVSVDKIIGKTTVVFWPLDQMGKVN